jgi:hypothetical protein
MGEPKDTDEARAERRTDRIEILEVIVLALVTIATAWTGYQATQWGGRQSTLYGQASTTRFAADAASTLGGQVLSADASMFTAWLQAKETGNTQLQDLLVRRFSPAYRVAFLDWVKTDPFNDPSAPPGPGYMPSFHQPDLAKAAALNDQASMLFAQGTSARETANKYVRDTVLFASVLFLIGASQRFRARRVRIASSALAVALLTFTLISLATLPRS